MSQSMMATVMEPYRKGTSFAQWVKRLEFCFIANEVSAARKKAFFISWGGQVVFQELELLYPNTDLMEVGYDDMIGKLKTRFDKTESDLIQGIKFSNRVQQPNETTEDFVLAVKLQAEFCGFGDHKEIAIRNRIVAGLLDQNLRQRLLNEEKLTLATAEKIITTWEMAGASAKSLGQNNQIDMVGSLSSSSNYGNQGRMLDKFHNVHEYSHNRISPDKHNKGSVKDRLGFKPNFKGYVNKAYKDNNSHKTFNKRVKFETNNWNRNDTRKYKVDYRSMICEYCGMQGHVKKRCFKLRNMQRQAVNLIDLEKPEPSEDKRLNELLNRLRTDDSDDDGDKGELS